MTTGRINQVYLGQFYEPPKPSANTTNKKLPIEKVIMTLKRTAISPMNFACRLFGRPLAK